MTFVRAIAALLLGFALAACDTMSGMGDWVTGDWTMSGGASCEERTARALETVDFAEARVVDVVVRNGEFSPMILRLTGGSPYVLRLRNRDDAGHTFSAPEFFEQTAVAAVAVGNDIIDEACFTSVDLEPLQTVEMQLVPLKDGSYEFHDEGWLAGLGGGWVPSGVIRVEEPY